MPIPGVLGMLAGQAGGAAMGMALGGYNDNRQAKQQERLQQIQIKGQKEMADYNYKRQMNMWEATNYAAQIEQMNKAGINPGLLYGMSGGGGTTTGSQGGSVGGATATQGGGGEAMGMAAMGIQLPTMMAQKDLIEAQTKLAETQATKIGGADTANVEADTQNKILQQVIQNYAGKEAADQYTRIKAPNRAIEAETYQKDMEAKQGIAGTIYELWTEGKLKEKSIAEIESILLRNAKTREETKNIHRTMDLIEANIKGAQLDNIIKDLETRLQTETGIDRNSPYWLKILGRLFVQLTGK